MTQGKLAAGLSLSDSALALGVPAAAQTIQSAPSSETAAEAQVAPEADAGNQIVVIGSCVANRTVSDSPVPSDVIFDSALQASGRGELNKTLNPLVPSFNFPQPSIADGLDVTRPATLRGLNPDQTLVVLNGKCRRVSALINGTVGRGGGRHEHDRGARDPADRNALCGFSPLGFNGRLSYARAAVNF